MAHLHAALQARQIAAPALHAVSAAARDGRVRALLAAEGVMPVLLECAIDRANTDDGPIAVAALSSLTDAEPSALSSLASRAVERKAELVRLVHEPQKAHSAAALISVLAKALPQARPLFVDLAGMLPILAPRLEPTASAQLAKDTVLLVQDDALRDLLS